MRTVEEIDKEIEKTKEELKNVKGTECEVYSRIVGYYRDVSHWNKGKRDEFNHRKTFDEPGRNKTEETTNTEQVCESCKLDTAKEETVNISDTDIFAAQLFVKPSCPNCPPVKKWMEDNFKAQCQTFVCAPNSEDIQTAAKLGVMACPTVIFYNIDGNEVLRCHSVDELNDFKSKYTIVSITMGETA